VKTEIEEEAESNSRVKPATDTEIVTLDSETQCKHSFAAAGKTSAHII
jgi:hypothetical protein